MLKLSIIIPRSNAPHTDGMYGVAVWWVCLRYLIERLIILSIYILYRSGTIFYPHVVWRNETYQFVILNGITYFNGKQGLPATIQVL